MGDNRESKQKDALEDMTGLDDNKTVYPKSKEYYLAQLNKEYHTDVLTNKGIVTKANLDFIAEIDYEIEKYMHNTNSNRSSAILGVFASRGGLRKRGSEIQSEYEQLLEKIMPYRKML